MANHDVTIPKINNIVTKGLQRFPVRFRRADLPPNTVLTLLIDSESVPILTSFKENFEVMRFLGYWGKNNRNIAPSSGHI